MWIAFVLEAVAIVTGNVTVLVVFTRTPSLRKRKHYLLVSLAVADLLVGLVSIPMFVMMNFIHTNQTFLDVYYFQDIFFGTASVFGLTAVAIERVYAVYYPFKHRTLGKCAYIISISVVWLIALFLALSILYISGDMSLTIAIAIILSLVIVAFSYVLIWIKIKCMTNIQGHAIHVDDKKLTVTLLIVIVVSLISWIPFMTIGLMYKFCSNCPDVGYTIVQVFKLLHYGNSFVNPIIYVLRMPQFRNSLLYPLKCHRIDEIYGNGIRNHDNLRNNDNNSSGNNDSDHGNNDSDHGNNDSDHGNNDSDHGNNDSDHGSNDSDHGNNDSDHGNNDSDHGNNDSDHGNNDSDHGNNDSDHGNNDSHHGNNDSHHGNKDSYHGNVVEISKSISSQETSV